MNQRTGKFIALASCLPKVEAIANASDITNIAKPTEAPIAMIRTHFDMVLLSRSANGSLVDIKFFTACRIIRARKYL